nr:hypothetical protein CFP56_38763 [Quercus suber]
MFSELCPSTIIDIWRDGLVSGLKHKQPGRSHLRLEYELPYCFRGFAQGCYRQNYGPSRQRVGYSPVRPSDKWAVYAIALRSPLETQLFDRPALLYATLPCPSGVKTIEATITAIRKAYTSASRDRMTCRLSPGCHYSPTWSAPSVAELSIFMQLIARIDFTIANVTSRKDVAYFSDSGKMRTLQHREISWNYLLCSKACRMILLMTMVDARSMYKCLVVYSELRGDLCDRELESRL